VAGIIGYFLNQLDDTLDSSSLARWIYVEVLACLTIIFALLFLLPTFLAIFVWPSALCLNFLKVVKLVADF
jgi:hypothetical protein